MTDLFSRISLTYIMFVDVAIHSRLVKRAGREDLTERVTTPSRFLSELTFTALFSSHTTNIIFVRPLNNFITPFVMPPLSTTSILLSPSGSSKSSSDTSLSRPLVPPQPQRPPSNTAVVETSMATTPTPNLPEPTRAVSPSYSVTDLASTSAVAGLSRPTRRTRANFEVLTDDTYSPSETVAGSQRLRKRIHLDLRDQNGSRGNNQKSGKTGLTSASTTSERGRINPKRRVIPPPPVELEGEDVSKELITEYNCPICLCPPSEACVTPCGHLMCFACLRNSLLSHPQSIHRHTTQSVSPETNLEGSCPVCRKVLPGGLLGDNPGKGKGKSKGGKKAKPGVVKIELKLIDLVKD